MRHRGRCSVRWEPRGKHRTRWRKVKIGAVCMQNCVNARTHGHWQRTNHDNSVYWGLLYSIGYKWACGDNNLSTRSEVLEHFTDANAKDCTSVTRETVAYAVLEHRILFKHESWNLLVQIPHTKRVRHIPERLELSTIDMKVAACSLRHSQESCIVLFRCYCEIERSDHSQQHIRNAEDDPTNTEVDPCNMSHYSLCKDSSEQHSKISYQSQCQKRYENDLHCHVYWLLVRGRTCRDVNQSII